MNLDNLPEYTEVSKLSPKFMKVSLGPSKATTWIQRGYR